MSEDIRAGTSEQRCGHIVVQTEFGEVLSLNLFETPDLVCQGYYLPPPGSALRREEESPLRPLLEAVAVELQAAEAAIEEAQQSAFIETASGQEDNLFFELNTSRFETYGGLARVPRRSEAGPEVWTGRANAGRQLSFVLERYDDSSKKIVILITLIFVLLHGDGQIADLDYECMRRAIEACGERGVKSYGVRRTLVSILEPGGFSYDCEFECW